MNAAPALLAYAAGVGLVGPRVLLRSAWPHRAPALGAAVWTALMLSFTLAVALVTAQLAMPSGHLHTGLFGLLHACGLDRLADPGTLGALTTPLDGVAAPPLAAVVAPFAVLGGLAGAFLFRLARAGRLRARHRDRLDKVGVRSARLGATVLPHRTAAAWCLPGLRSRVVVSDAAVRLLTDEQLDAVLEHERAHVAGRHHLPLALADAFATVFPRLPLARHARAELAVLLEMVADDRSLRSHPYEVVATAMYEMAAARAPKGAFAVGGPTALLRMRRVLGPRRSPHPALRGSLVSFALAAPLLPLLVACPPGL
ncbi:M56 family metallopeptidase [Streptomyces sp. NPDC004267]|uniref:M56 family metallopeptidase n=1 Tax=Streptomyces sp. NPDC004267 TaxID=3364694 RepID=UPI00369BDA14